MKKPPAPCVSCPMTPCASGIRSSSARASKPPGRKLVRTTSASVRPARRSVVAETLRSSPRARAICSHSLRTTSSRSGSRSTRTISDPANAVPRSTSEATVPGARVLPPPMYVSLIRATVPSTPPLFACVRGQRTGNRRRSRIASSRAAAQAKRCAAEKLCQPRLGEDHPSGDRLQNADHGDVELALKVTATALHDDHRAVLEIRDALAWLLALLDHLDMHLVTRQERGLDRVRE